MVCGTPPTSPAIAATTRDAGRFHFSSPLLELAYFDTGDYPTTRGAEKEALLTRCREIVDAEAAAKGFAQGGEPGLLEAQLSEQIKLYAQGKTSPYYVARTEARLGNKREALKYLALCVQSHDERVLGVSCDRALPAFAALRPSINC